MTLWRVGRVPKESMHEDFYWALGTVGSMQETQASDVPIEIST